MAEATQEMIALAREIAGDVWERRAMAWREREKLPDNPAWRVPTRKAWERGDYDAEDAVQAALAAIQATTERAAKLAHRMSAKQMTAFSVGEAIRAAAHLKEQSA